MANQKNEGKTSVISVIIAALCIMLYLGGLTYGALSIYNSVTERRSLADREFDSLANLVSTAGVSGFMTEPFIQIVQDTIDGSQTLLGVVITGSRGEFAFERERGTVINWVNDSPRFVPRFAVTNPPKYLALRIDGQRNANIRAVSGYLDYDFCITILKRTLLVVLFSLTLAFFTLLMDSLLARNRFQDSRESHENPSDRSSGGERPPAPEGGTGDSGAGTRPEPAGTESGRTEDRVPAGTPVGIPTEISAGIPDDWTAPDDDDDDDEPDFNFDDETPGGDSAGEDVFESPEPEIPEQGSPKEAPAGGMPQGLFSPRGSVGWEAYTEDRLDSELHRCASTEQDLALIIAMVKEPGALSNEQFRRFCQEAVLFFEHRDLIFEWQEQGISIICPNLSLEQAFARSEEFNTRVLGKLSRPAGSRIDLRFGISSRSGRLIEAKQIMLEAGEALERAAGDPASHIVAFKSDPEKYRQYIGKRR
ncbi:MAG: hypothetical protein LBL56_07950 [Treponema sp.]|jgi:hypothetical protein|nr:hypothetical protein [Treponema sp.]